MVIYFILFFVIFYNNKKYTREEKGIGMYYKYKNPLDSFFFVAFFFFFDHNLAQSNDHLFKLIDVWCSQRLVR